MQNQLMTLSKQRIRELLHLIDQANTIDEVKTIVADINDNEIANQIILYEMFPSSQQFITLIKKVRKIISKYLRSDTVEQDNTITIYLNMLSKLVISFSIDQPDFASEAVRHCLDVVTIKYPNARPQILAAITALREKLEGIKSIISIKGIK